MNSKRIEKHLINRDDMMFFHSDDFRIYVDTHCNDLGGIYFVMTVYSDNRPEHSQHSQYAETREIIDVAELERSMKEASGDMRKWRVLKNGTL